MTKKSKQSSSPHACPPSAMPHYGQKSGGTGVPAWKMKKETHK